MYFSFKQNGERSAKPVILYVIIYKFMFAQEREREFKMKNIFRFLFLSLHFLKNSPKLFLNIFFSHKLQFNFT